MESWFIGYSLKEDIVNEQIAILIYFIRDYTQALSYLLKDSYCKIHKLENDEHKNFKDIWNTIKTNYDSYGDMYTNAKTGIDKFIKLFEENEKEINEELSKAIKEIK